MKRFFLCILILLFIAVFTTGCNQTLSDDEMNSDGGSEIQRDNTDSAHIKPEWTAEPALEMIPNMPVSGMANGVEFYANTVFFEPRFGKWRLVLAEEELTSPTGPLPGGQSINIDMPEIPEEGSVFIKEMAYGNGYFQIRKKDSEDTTSWNADNAYAIKITKWDVEDFNPELGAFQLAGKASGRVFIAYSGENWEDFDDSWAAGTFTDVNVRFMGEPEWE